VTCAIAPIASSRYFFSVTATPTPMLTTILTNFGIAWGLVRDSAEPSVGRTVFR
jgi:hypothetical protein